MARSGVRGAVPVTLLLPPNLAAIDLNPSFIQWGNASGKGVQHSRFSGKGTTPADHGVFARPKEGADTT